MHPIIHHELNKPGSLTFTARPSGTGSAWPPTRPAAPAGNTARTRPAAARPASSPAAC